MYKATIGRAVMAAALLAIVIIGCDNGGGPGPVITPTPYVTGIEVFTGGATEVTKGIPLQFGVTVYWSNYAVTTIAPADAAAQADQIRQYAAFTILSWVSADDPDSGTRISDTGLLTVALAESVSTIQVRGAYKGNPTLYKDVELTVKEPTVTPSVTGISISGDASVARGSSITLTSQVTTDPAGADTSVTWSITTLGIGAGTQLSSSTGSTVTLSVDAGESNSSIEVKITSNLDNTKTATKTITVTLPGEKDFLTEYAELGLPAASYTASSLIDAMEGRVDDLVPRSSFYSPKILEVPDQFDYGTGIKFDEVALYEPGMAWFFYNDDLVVYGSATHSITYIVFNVAVINASTGKGWITGDGDDPYPNTYKRDSYAPDRSEAIPISSLTGGNITTAAGLDGYHVYIIVRGLSSHSNIGDLNTTVYVDYNVIKPQ
ncbi:MAG: hypothetical protein LBQ55_03210 [Treponema sp.]|nr:hypothetical protein [Treponema sp.]